MKIRGLPRKWHDISKSLSENKQVQFLNESFALYRQSPMRFLALWMLGIVFGVAFWYSWSGKVFMFLLLFHIIYVLGSYLILYDKFLRNWR